MPYWRLFYHIVWATKNREPLIDAETTRVISQSLRSTMDSFDAIPHGIGFMPDHVHVAVSISPGKAVSDVVARMKGSSSHAVNEAHPGRSFAWQAEYGVLSFGEKSLPEVRDYVLNQVERHTKNDLFAGMERTTTAPQPASAGLSESARGVHPRAADGEDVELSKQP